MHLINISCDCVITVLKFICTPIQALSLYSFLLTSSLLVLSSKTNNIKELGSKARVPNKILEMIF